MQRKSRELLLENPIFEQLTKAELLSIDGYLHSHHMEANETVFTEGGRGNYVCFVMEGQLQVLKKTPSGRDSVLATLESGQSVGEMAIIDGMPRSASVVTRTPVDLVLLKREDFENLLKEYPEVGAKILRAIAKMLSIKLRETSGNLMNLLLS